MSHPRRKKKIDSNQTELVRQLRSIPGVTVETDKDDLLIGRVVNGEPRTFWVEIKNPAAVKKNGELRKGALRDSQKKIKQEWKGQYLVAWTLEQILQEIGITKS
jgi:hypothetical protein